VVAVVAVLASQTPTVSAGTIIRAADVTDHVAGADIGGTVDVNAAGQSISMDLSGYESLARHDGLLKFNINGAPGISSSTATFQMRFIYPVFYMSSPLFASALPSGKQWLKFNVASLLSKQGVNPAVLSTTQSDPTQYLQYLKATSGGVQNLGTETIRGVETTHYHAVSDLSRYAALLPASKRAAARKTFSHLQQLTGTHQIPIDVWIDSHNLVRQMQVKLAVHPSSGALAGKTLSEKVTVDLFNFGPKPAVAPPPADQTEDLNALVGSGI
jgi:hypothetical protein